MKRFFKPRIILLLLPLLAMSIGPLNAQTTKTTAPGDELFQTIASLDTALFDAYNRCDLDKFASFLSDDLEFYHDQAGLSRGPQSTLDSLKKYVCGKVRRELVAGTLEVYPLHGYGAVEMGVHRFCDPKLGKCGAGSGEAKFLQLWQNKEGVWKLTRIISYDHCSTCVSVAKPE